MLITPGWTNLMSHIDKYVAAFVFVLERRRWTSRSALPWCDRRPLSAVRGAVSVDERALGYRQEYRHVDDDRPTTAVPVAGAVAAPADDADANTNAAPPPYPTLLPPPLLSNAIFASPPPGISLQRHRTLPSMPQLPLNPIFIIHRHHLVLCGTILCHVGNTGIIILIIFFSVSIRFLILYPVATPATVKETYCFQRPTKIILIEPFVLPKTILCNVKIACSV